MRAVIQRVKHARVFVAGEVKGKIGPGVLVFLGVGQDDTAEAIPWLVNRITRLRIFEDEADKMNLSLSDVGGEALVISQFTLWGNLKKGTRPSFNRAAAPEQAVPLYETFVAQLREALGKPVPTGEFGAMMEIEALNHGPVTLFVDTQMRDR